MRITVVLLDSNVVIGVDSDRYQIRQVRATRQFNRSKRLTNDGSVLGKPNNKQTILQNNTDTLWMDVGTFNIRYVIVGLVLV